MAPQTIDQSEPNSGGRLIRFVIPVPQRQSNRRILMYLPQCEPDRQDFKAELERCLQGQ